MEAGAGRNSDIEILRAVAVCFVLFHHARDMLLPMTADFAERLPFGPAGVDLFFVISGLVIGKSLLPRLQSAANSRLRWREVLAFWTRRAFRLLPTAWLWLAIILAATAAFAFHSADLNFRTNVDATLAGVFYYANFRFADAFQHYAYGASFHYWSLSLEEQFYILLPLVALLGRKWLVWIILAAIAFDQLREPSRIAVITRATGLLLGVLMAIWSEKPSYQKLKNFATKAGPAPLLVCLIAVALLPFLEPRSGAVALSAAAAVLMASFDRNVITPPQWPLRDIGAWFGARSYALYVIHAPLFLMAFDLSQSAGVFRPPTSSLLASFEIAAAFALLFVLAELNFRFVERPLRDYGATLARRITKARGNVMR